MLTLYRVFIKTAIVYLLLGTALGGFLLVNKGWLHRTIRHGWITVPNHRISVGFIVMYYSCIYKPLASGRMVLQCK